MGKAPQGYWECPKCFDYVDNKYSDCPHCKAVSGGYRNVKPLQPASYPSSKLINREYRIRCNVCGKVFCYTDDDLKENKTNKAFSVLGAASAALNTVAGSRYDAYESIKIADRKGSRIVDYNRCPNCNSTNISTLTEQEWEQMQKQNNATNVAAASFNSSAIDEIKRYKELLDIGILTQEEFDAKKKQLLGL